jgi:hypothetical protein
MRNEKEIRVEIEQLQIHRDYLNDFLTKNIPDNDNNEKNALKECIYLDIQIDQLKWVLDEDLKKNK